MNIWIENEYDRLTDVVVGNSFNFKSQINFRDLYDPISLLNYLKGKFPNKFKLQNQISIFKKVLKKYNVKIHDLDIINANQIFTRDLGFIIRDKFFISSILPDREIEIEGLKNIFKKIKSTVKLPKNAHIEGGDVVLDDGHIFIGYYGQKDYKNQITARTNKKAIKLIRKHFPGKKTVPLEIIKSPYLPTSNALHLDCCFQPLSNSKAVICKKAFKNPMELNYLISLYGNENIFEITLKEMSKLYSNFFSIDKKTVISDKRFKRLNDWLTDIGMEVEKINYSEIAKLGGLFRCSTLPLSRKKI